MEEYLMFEIDLNSMLEKDLLIIDCNTNAMPNSEIIYYKGDINKIAKSLVGNLLIEEVKINVEDSSIFTSSHSGYEYVVENIPIISGSKSLIYYGHEKPVLQKGVEWICLDENSNLIRIARLLSTFATKTDESYKKYFELINSRLVCLIEDLNLAIKFHNEKIELFAKKSAKGLHDLYVNHPEILGIK